MKLIKLGLITTITMPIAVVVSCSKSNSDSSKLDSGSDWISLKTSIYPNILQWIKIKTITAIIIWGSYIDIFVGNQNHVIHISELKRVKELYS